MHKAAVIVGRVQFAINFRLKFIFICFFTFSHIVSCGMDKTIILWDVSTGQSLRKYRGHLGTVNCVKFNEDSSVAISGSVDTSIRCWDCRSKKPEAFQIMQEAKDSVSSVQVTDHEILTGSLDGQIRRYDIRNGEMIADEMARKFSVSLQKLCCSTNNEICLFSLDPITSVWFTRDGQGLLVSCLDSTLRLIDKDTGELLQE
jgi:mitogen-activated protein kinase organizer 1